MSENPLEESPHSNHHTSPSGHATPKNPLMIPAILLLVLSTLFLLLLIFSLPFQVARIANIDTSTSEGAGELTGSIVCLFVWTFFMLAIIAGSICMLCLKGYSGALTAAILAVIPVCSPCFVLGIPFGIWAIVLLRKPDVKERFT